MQTRRAFLSSVLALPIVNRFFPAPIYTTLAPPREYSEAECTIRVGEPVMHDEYFEVDADPLIYERIH